MDRRTRTVATLGPATDSPGVLEKLLDAGLNLARINFAHGSADEHQRRIESVRRAAHAAHRTVSVLADLPGPKLRALLDAPLDLHIGQIVDAFDGIMVARGDLGVEIALERVRHVQKRPIDLARVAGKPVITATDMLDSMRHSPRPTRAEMSDVANAVYDGTDAVMLSGETADGNYPVEALQCMNNIPLEAERHQTDSKPHKGGLSDHVTHTTCALAYEVKAAAIIAPTITGRTARLVARHRPRAAIVAVSSSEEVLRQLGLIWGVHAVTVPFPICNGDDRLETAVRAAFLGSAVKPGEFVVVLAGHPVKGGQGFPTIRVVRVGEDGQSREP